MAKTAALLWDESFIWGIMSFKALSACGLSFELVRAEDIRNGISDKYGFLFVPGGWASNKIKALGAEAVESIRRFVFGGGAYMGFCGGAGLATNDGIGLIDVKRMPTAQRVPSLSGRVSVRLTDHPIWAGVKSDVFHVWWPSQFLLNSTVPKVIASYLSVCDDAFSSDINVGMVSKVGNWDALEGLYGINLNPSRLTGEPLIIEGSYGNGRVILSLIHFDTPNDTNGQLVLKNLWDYMGIASPAGDLYDPRDCYDEEQVLKGKGDQADCEGRLLMDTAQQLIDLGRDNFLWFWRNEMLLQWRRGVRGLECCNLYIMIKELCRLLCATHGQPDRAEIANRLRVLRGDVNAFIDELKRLLFLERLEMQRSHITYERSHNEEINELRTRLFSKSKSYGGRYKALLDVIDNILFSLLRHFQRQ